MILICQLVGSYQNSLPQLLLTPGNEKLAQYVQLLQLLSNMSNYCLRCEQNVEFNKTDAPDREQAASTNSNGGSSSSSGSSSRSTESVLSPNRLREKRSYAL